MSRIIEECQSLDFESALSSAKEKEREIDTQHSAYRDYESWLEARRDHWLKEAVGKQSEINRILFDIGQIILNQSTVHAPCDARYIARCNPQEEQELGREQVLDEIRALIEKWSK